MKSFSRAVKGWVKYLYLLNMVYGYSTGKVSALIRGVFLVDVCGHTGTSILIRNGLRWFAASDQAEKNRPVKNVLLEKEGHHANRTAHFP